MTSQRLPWQHIPEGANFLRMQDTLATSGGRLLVNVLRDMLSGRVGPYFTLFTLGC